jgi:hypothetical protein
VRKRPNQKTVGLVLALVALLTSTVPAGGCAKAPPNLSPVGVRAFHATRAVQVLDLVRDTAIAAEAATPQLLSTESTRAVVTWHRAAVAAAGATPAGWQASVLAGLENVERALKPDEQQVLRPYLVLAKSILREVA